MEFNLKPIFKIDKEYFKDECNIKTFNKITLCIRFLGV